MGLSIWQVARRPPAAGPTRDEVKAGYQQRAAIGSQALTPSPSPNNGERESFGEPLTGDRFPVGPPGR